MSASDFDPFVTPVDYVKIGGLKSPGIARVLGAGSRRKVDIRGAYGISATIAIWLEIAEFKIEIDLFTRQDWIDFWAWKAAALKDIQPNRRNKASDFATDIWHPLLAAYDIKSIIVKSVTVPEECDPTGVWRVTIECVEFRQASLSLSKPEASKSKPKDDVDRRLDANTAEIQRLNQELAK